VTWQDIVLWIKEHPKSAIPVPCNHDGRKDRRTQDAGDRHASKNPVILYPMDPKTADG